MSLELFSLNADLKRLRDEGYCVQVKGGYLILRDVPYVNAARKVLKGSLISSLNLAGNLTQMPDTHVIFFDGEYPCKADGSPIQSISKSSGTFDLGSGIVAKHDFSSRPEAGYPDYYHKMTTYAGILCGHARELDPNANPKSLRSPEDHEEMIFNYLDTASARAGIGALADRLAGEIVGLIGIGGSGVYTLDQVAKTPVREIRLFDGDDFLQHNAFRAPGAPSLEELRQVQKKVDYFKGIYSKMHRGIVAHPEYINRNNVQLLEGLTFAFLSMDAGDDKKVVVEKLESLGIPFIDVGMGLTLEEGQLSGILRVTTSLPGHRELFREKVPFEGGGADDLYATNIQVADLNALNAILAVIKWKKLRGFYCDLERELHSSFTTDGNLLLNGGKAR